MERADCLVLFGATGNLAAKKLFPALYHLEARHLLEMPVVGVAINGWTDADLINFMSETVHEAVDDVNEGDLARLAHRLRYVAGDYQDPSTFQKLAGVVGTGCRPVHYLAIPPDMFETLVEGLQAAGLAERARLLSRSRSAAIWPAPATSTRYFIGYSPRSLFSESTISWGRNPCRTCSCSASQISC